MMEPGNFEGMKQKLSDKEVMVRALNEIKRLKHRVAALEHGGAEAVAVIGMGCRFPGGSSSPEKFWQLLMAGRDGVCEIPADRWDVDAWYDPADFCVDKMYTRHGGFLEDVLSFDHEAFGISAREAAGMDPQQRMVLEVCRDALGDAGVHDYSLLAGGATGVFIGAIANDYFQRFVDNPVLMDSRTGTGNSNSVLAGRLSFHYGFTGPSWVVDTSCSSSLVALHQACQSLRAGECSMAIAGGVNLIMHPTRMVALCRARILSPDGRCKTFDAAADGYGRGEGCGVVVLKRLSDAQRAGDVIQAVVPGSAVNHNGHGSGLTVPGVAAQQAVIEAALRMAGLKSEEVGYVEAHGTGTALGDPLEMEALCHVYRKTSNQKLVVGSVKTNIGHLEAAAGVAAFIKAVMMVRNGEIPAHLHVKTPNPHIPWDGMPVIIPRNAQMWPDYAEKRIAGVSSFGFSGTNAHMLVQES
ncbi:MAG: polyketide synthase [Spartobacteria bacterium]|nr:polyketide synthase [Spartobacteria bacterium]